MTYKQNIAAVLILGLSGFFGVPLAEAEDCPDILIADSAASRFTPNVLPLALAKVTLRSDSDLINVMQPCDTPASACGNGADPTQVIGGINDWTGFVLPGFE